ncbi:hypothetical protein H310_08733 [Aphanomyces invadans]|uniref:Uncharacterized protein n=1 Tax=Aphanomyces invadans TaxID=157072 RepID=A0A024TWR6_9STRA|nr:hypothetical protein H310_08733 [Aphanomyces invadans]ETV98615.1 hypothetical protein H310_08733 [Aphanomyces invadans]|eukprot:XP_008872812.1 hypothetical protein H310_08733 [Aphanomyces invadans]
MDGASGEMTPAKSLGETNPHPTSRMAHPTHEHSACHTMVSCVNRALLRFTAFICHWHDVTCAMWDALHPPTFDSCASPPRRVPTTLANWRAAACARLRRPQLDCEQIRSSASRERSRQNGRHPSEPSPVQVDRQCRVYCRGLQPIGSALYRRRGRV